MTGLVGVLPWQTVVGDRQPDIGAFLAAAARPAAQAAVRASLRRPGIAMGVTAALDLVVTLLLGGPLAPAAPRALLGGATSALSIVTGSRGGPMRTLSGALGVVTAVVQGGSLLWGLVAGFGSGEPLLTLAPMLLATASALVMAVKTIAVAFRGRS